MVNSASAAGFIGLCAGITALEIFYFLEPHSGTTPSAGLLESALELLLPLAAVGALLTAVAVIYSHHLRHAANRRLSGFVIFVLCVSAGVLDIFFFVVQPAGCAVDRGAQARALGLGALRALPTAATATFFWGVMLIIVAHARAGVAEAGFVGAIPGPVRVLTKIALGAAAGLVFLVTVAFGIKY